MEVRFSDGTTTYNLHTGDVTLLSYTPTVGDRSKDRVTDTLEILIAASSLDNQQATKDEINSWMSIAREMWETVSETRIWIEIRQADETDWRRAELLGGRLQPVSGTLDGHSQLKQLYQLVFERRNWWEWPEEELALSSDNSSFSTGGMEITNNGNAIYMRGTDILGDPQMPVPCRLELTVDGAEWTDAATFYIAHNVFAELSDADVDQHILEGESATPTSGAESVADARGGQVNRYTWSGGPMSGTHALKFPLSGALLSDLGGRWYRLLLVCKGTFTAPMYARFGLFWSGYSSGSQQPVATTDEIELPANGETFSLLDMGALQLPTFVPGAHTPAALTLTLILRTVYTSGTLDVDFLALMPTDSIHVASMAGTIGIAQKWIMDGRLPKSYVVTWSEGAAMESMSDVSKHISLWPGRDQWISIVNTFDAGYFYLADAWTLRAYYRPRRSTV